MQTKPFYTSATFWFNIAAGVYEVLANFGGFDNVPPEYRAAILVVGNLLLRVKTTKPISLT